MARYIDSVCKLCRREGLKLFFKGARCNSDKCAFERRSYAPGQHGQRRRAKVSEYALQLREKQKVKRLYGLMEKQFRNVFKKADRMKGVTGEHLLSLLERRFDSVVYRLGLAGSRREARQFIVHGKYHINGKPVNIPSYLLKLGDLVQVAEKNKNAENLKEAMESSEYRGIPQWLELDKENMKGTLKALPVREDITVPIQEQLIVELYSKV